jgi:hypothetical protein
MYSQGECEHGSDKQVGDQTTTGTASVIEKIQLLIGHRLNLMLEEIQDEKEKQQIQFDDFKQQSEELIQKNQDLSRTTEILFQEYGQRTRCNDEQKIKMDELCRSNEELFRRNDEITRCNDEQKIKFDELSDKLNTLMKITNNQKTSVMRRLVENVSVMTDGRVKPTACFGTSELYQWPNDQNCFLFLAFIGIFVATAAYRAAKTNKKTNTLYSLFIQSWSVLPTNFVPVT